MKTQEYKDFVFDEMKDLYDDPIDYIDFEELYDDLTIEDKLTIGTKFGETKALLEQSRILNHG